MYEDYIAENTGRKEKTLGPETIVTIVDWMSHSVSSIKRGPESRPGCSTRSRGEWRFLPGSSNLHRIAAMHGFSTRAHGSAKIAALAALPGSCALDVPEETSVSARMSVTRMGISAQSLDEYLDGRPDYNART